MSIAIVGATGLVGRTMLELAVRNFPKQEFLCVTSERSRGGKIQVAGREYQLLGIEDLLQEEAVRVILWAADATSSLEYAPKFASKGIYVVDNSVAWRRHSEHKLIVPEVNINTLNQEDYIIANPNCSTIQLVVPLYPLHLAYGIERVVVSTYQSVSGSGMAGIGQLQAEMDNKNDNRFYKHSILANLIPFIDDFREDGYTKEEEKMMFEFGKIIGDSSVKLTATAVRVPVFVGHAESVNITFKKSFVLSELCAILAGSQGVVVVDDPIHKNLTPKSVAGEDKIFVGRIREDYSCEKSLNMWIVGDNVRKGAATNALQIVNYLFQQGWLGE